MRHLTERVTQTNAVEDSICLDFDARQKCRMRVVAESGEVVGISVQRGTTLKHGDLLREPGGPTYAILAAAETLSRVRCDDPVDLARAAYHLGNRHVRLQVEPGAVLYQADHVLDQMIEQLGFVVERVEHPFEPEPGAYHRHVAAGHSHSHAHSHDHEHVHADDHRHSHSHAHSHEHPHAPSDRDPS